MHEPPPPIHTHAYTHMPCVYTHTCHMPCYSFCSELKSSEHAQLLKKWLPDYLTCLCDLASTSHEDVVFLVIDSMQMVVRVSGNAQTLVPGGLNECCHTCRWIYPRLHNVHIKLFPWQHHFSSNTLMVSHFVSHYMEVCLCVCVMCCVCVCVCVYSSVYSSCMYVYHTPDIGLVKMVAQKCYFSV